jgi:hypothetical protein
MNKPRQLVALQLAQVARGEAHDCVLPQCGDAFDQAILKVDYTIGSTACDCVVAMRGYLVHSSAHDVSYVLQKHCTYILMP